jgi:hypothetical protein
MGHAAYFSCGGLTAVLVNRLKTAFVRIASAGNGALGHAFVSQIDDVPAPVDVLAGGVHGGI